MHTPTVTLAAAVAAALFSMNASAATCADLAKLTLPDTKITTAESVSGTFAAPGVRDPLKVPSICRVAGVVSPAIKFEVWLPEGSAWNGKFEAVGGGGLAGITAGGAPRMICPPGFHSMFKETEGMLWKPGDSDPDALHAPTINRCALRATTRAALHAGAASDGYRSAAARDCESGFALGDTEMRRAIRWVQWLGAGRAGAGG